jgi:prepilin peptidase CpaA
LPQISNWAFVALASGVGVATVVDLRTRRIPNVVTALMAGAGFGFAASGVGNLSLGGAALGLVFGLMLMLPGHALGATGAGDVKLMGAIGTLVGPVGVINAFLFTAIAGGVLACIIAIRRKRLGATVAGTARLIGTPAGARQEIHAAPSSRRFAYGPAIAVGSVIAALVS